MAAPGANKVIGRPWFSVSGPQYVPTTVPAVNVCVLVSINKSLLASGVVDGPVRMSIIDDML